MNTQLQLQELSISLAVKKFQPSALNPDFLKYSNIIPNDWELARPPVYEKQLVQIVFKNGVGIMARPRRIVFAENIETKPLSDASIAEVARRCIDTLPNLEYQSVEITPRAYASQPATGKFISSLLVAGEWQSFGTDTMQQAALQLNYPYENGQFNLSINDGALKTPDSEDTSPVVVFSGSFSFPLQGDSHPTKLDALHQCIQNWQATVQTYQAFISNKFLETQAEPQLVSWSYK